VSEKILEVKNLVTSFQTENGSVRAVDGVSFSVPAGKTLGIVGESGCGKSVTSLSIMRLLPKPAGNIDQGEILYKGQDIAKLKPEDLYKIRGNNISMIFQEPMTALNPVHKISSQLGETFELHFPDMSKQEVHTACVEMLEKVGIPDPAERLNDYPHQLSGGMRQRVMIAIALACKPDILIADEPTTALDVTIQAQILELMKEFQKESGMAIVFITHDLGVIAEVCDEVMVMYAGRVAEKAEVKELFKNPKHPYTKGLLSSIPRLDSPHKKPLATIEGMVPSLFEMPEGCRFQNRCDFADEGCKKIPKVTDLGNDHLVYCHKHQEVK
jgi:oligopeptide/dipeptide ABC transporter ATP-binding protein